QAMITALAQASSAVDFRGDDVQRRANACFTSDLRLAIVVSDQHRIFADVAEGVVKWHAKAHAAAIAAEAERVAIFREHPDAAADSERAVGKVTADVAAESRRQTVTER